MRDKVINKQNFEELEATSEYMETHYYKETDNKNSQQLVRINRFWADYA